MHNVIDFHASRHTERRVSLSRLSLVLANLAFWAAVISSVALIVR